MARDSTSFVCLACRWQGISSCLFSLTNWDRRVPITGPSWFCNRASSWMLSHLEENFAVLPCFVWKRVWFFLLAVRLLTPIKRPLPASSSRVTLPRDPERFWMLWCSNKSPAAEPTSTVTGSKALCKGVSGYNSSDSTGARQMITAVAFASGVLYFPYTSHKKLGNNLLSAEPWMWEG